LIIVAAGALVRTKAAHDSAVARFTGAITADTSFSGQRDAYRTLLEAIGPQAQEVLLAHFPPNARTHALNHESGIYLYDTMGAAGIFECKNYFNGSCYHGFIERIIADRGIGALNDTIKLCSGNRPIEQARECSHGVGHAFLVLTGYEHLPEAVAKCRSEFAGTDEAIGDCNDGVFMENNFGGFETPPSDRWYDANDPQYPCDAPEIRADAIAHASCWFMQSQATLSKTMYPRFDGSMEKVAAYCARIQDAEDKRVCDQGLARQIQFAAGADLSRIQANCALAYPKDPTQCEMDASDSAYAFGAEATAIALCDNSGTHIGDCYNQLYERISSTSYHTLSERLAACARLNEAARADVCSAYARAHTNP
jgi:hypothetical protein